MGTFPRKGLQAFLASLLLFAGSTPVQAVLYAPGETLDPACAPLDVGCGVSSGVGTGLQGQVPYYAANGRVLTATSSISILTTGDVSLAHALMVADVEGTRANLGLAYASNDGFSSDPIAAWGDSLTAGGGTDGYTDDLAREYNNTRTIYNGGVGGETSVQVRARFMAAPEKWSHTTIIWIGQNNNQFPDQIKSDIADIVAELDHGRYLVLSLITAGDEPAGSLVYERKMQLNADLAALYGEHYLDVHQILVDSYDPDSPQDVTDHANDTVPASLRFDNIHLSASGDAIIAQAVHDYLVATIEPSPVGILTTQNLYSLFAAPGPIGTHTPSSGFFSSLSIASTSTSTPAYPLDVYGSINASGPSAAYRLNGVTLLAASTSLSTIAIGSTVGVATGIENTSLGWQAFVPNSAGSRNVAIGKQSMSANLSGDNNVGVGAYALYAQISGARNTAVGQGAMQNNISGTNNVALGYLALQTATSTVGDTAVGYQALRASITGTANGISGNTALGAYALYVNTYGTTNTGVGYSALMANTIGTGNIGVGYRILSTNVTGNSNIAIGDDRTLSVATSSSYNIGIGSSALKSNTSGQFNIAIGVSDNSVNGALNNNTTGSDNIALGTLSLKNNTTGSGNVAIGSRALSNNTSATTSVAIGFRSAFGGAGNGAAYNNQGSTVVGYQAGTMFQTGSNYNTLLGYQSGYGITTGLSNIVIGSWPTSANSNVTTGSNNIIIGNNISATSSNATGQLNIGNIIFGTGVIGSASTIAGNVGIATSSPWRTFSVSGTVAMNGLTSSVGTGTLCLSLQGEVVYNASDNCLSSTRETKHDIQSLALSDLQMLQRLNPVSFVYNGDVTERIRYGFIADEADAVDPRLATRNAEGSLTGLDTSAFLALIVGAVQELSEKVSGFAESFTTKRLCVGETCVTEAEFKALLESANTAPAAPYISPAVPEAPSEPETSADPEAQDPVVPADEGEVSTEPAPEATVSAEVSAPAL